MTSIDVMKHEPCKIKRGLEHEMYACLVFGACTGWGLDYLATNEGVFEEHLSVVALCMFIVLVGCLLP